MLDRPRRLIAAFVHSESAGGIALMVATAFALIVANSPLAEIYLLALHQKIAGLSLLHWINDGLMALFFLLVGLEIKREMIEGELSDWKKRALPGIAAAGGMIAPALIFLAVTANHPQWTQGWAIPAATDIAFALGVITLLGSRVPASLKIALTALAILDDLGAIAIIALFYSHDLNLWMLGGALACALTLYGFNRASILRLWPYLLVGAVLWFFVLKSGVHATLAGVVLALLVPLKPRAHRAGVRAPLRRLEEALHPWSALVIVPVFGFANAGVSFAGFHAGVLAEPVPLGVACGLFFGKQIGMMLFSVAAIRLGIAQLPQGANWHSYYGMCLLCGIGFTMSLFIGYLAYPGSEALLDQVKYGIFAGSLLSGIAGAAVLMRKPLT